VPRFRRQKEERSSLTERVRDVAAEVARESQDRVAEVARDTPQRARELREAAAGLDIPWARSAPARWVRENLMQLVINPLLDHYAARRATGFETLASLDKPVILVANHASHMDTPVILSALPRKLRKRTAVAAAADYFYRNRIVASCVSLVFNTVPVDRKGGGGKSIDHLDSLLEDGWSILLYPEGTRSRGSGLGRMRRGAAVLASHHNLPIVPIRVTGTADAMPPGTMWPKRVRGTLLRRRHRIVVSFGDPIEPVSDTTALIEKVQTFFDATDVGQLARSPYRRRVKRHSRSAD
jgi:1-acyl-sn-glycerol-3-phosphate acyltransferase